jgi:lysyl-tRNA synthetase class 2
MKPRADWQPAADMAMLEIRAAMLTSARYFFAERNVLEVETPLLCRDGVTDPHIENIAVALAEGPHWLRTSPEYHMKRLVAAGSGDIYQIGKAFRGGENGRRHQTEFTMIEWYRCGFDVDQLIDDTCEFISWLSRCSSHPVTTHQRISYRDAFINTCALDPLVADAKELRTIALRWPGGICDEALAASIADDRPTWLDLLASHAVYPALANDILWVIDEYPADQAMLAQLNTNNPAVADRFEIFLNGIELANGFAELTDAAEQIERFASDRERRQAMQLPDILPDQKFVAAIQSGLPECAGVAVGLDRILMTTNNCSAIAETMSFVPGG